MDEFLFGIKEDRSQKDEQNKIKLELTSKLSVLLPISAPVVPLLPNC